MAYRKRISPAAHEEQSDCEQPPKNYAAITRKAGGSGIQLRVACRKRDKGLQSGHPGQ
jgi:hypothetical protein